MINVDVGWLVRRRRVGVSIGCVKFDAEVSFVRAQSENHLHAMQGCLMHEVYVLASFRAGAARGEPSQQLRAFLVPSDLTELFQCCRRMMAPAGG
jgi:hypothetical protein